ncbi:MAG TPA: PHB depolymerase family esterase [Tepidisphaeraceae bacterium]|nr:PHB depolymerase family esterase [Tepidisphaeraceae bacterium]
MPKPLTLAALLASLLLIPTTRAADAPADWPPTRQKESTFTDRKLETFTHGVRPAWGYAAPQRDTFLVLHPVADASAPRPEAGGARAGGGDAAKPKTKPPLYVVLHSAGHDVHSCLACTTKVGNHDIYHAPPGFVALYLDCRANKGDWWWGAEKFKGPDLSPVDRRVMDTVRWTIAAYDVDPDRVYLCGNSMGGSGALGIGLRHGDVFAAIKANVPARVEHVSMRMSFPAPEVPAGTNLPDPPICVDYSAPNDSWSKGHDGFVAAMRERRYALLMYWGNFGHANNHAQIEKINDLINSFDWLSVKRNEAYPVFTAASTDDALPWPADLKSTKPGQINAFFRWRVLADTADKAELSLFLTTPAEMKTTKFTLPTEATADVTLRRLQGLRLTPGDAVRWSWGEQSGEVKADAAGLVTIPKLKITAAPATLTVSKVAAAAK